MIQIVKATSAGVPILVVCTDCEPDPACVWQRGENDEFWSSSLPAWVRIHFRQSSLQRQL